LSGYWLSSRDLVESDPLALLTTPLGYFAAGSTFLLVSTIAFYPDFPPIRPLDELVVAFVFFTGVALVLHSLAWIRLFMATWMISLMRRHQEVLRIGLRRLFLASVLTFALLLLTFPIQLGAITPTFAWLFADSYPRALLASFTFGYLFVPYLPFLFGPVTTIHSAIFWRTVRISGRPPPPPIRIGVVLLVTPGIIGMIGELVFLSGILTYPGLSFWIFMPLPSGLTAPAYWILFHSFKSLSSS
jgi:hypothetical protein